MNSNNKLPLKDNANDFTDPCGDQEEIIDKIDCLQRDFAGFKAYLIQYLNETIDRALKERSKRRPYVEVGYRS
jgi:hypothetical protein